MRQKWRIMSAVAAVLLFLGGIAGCGAAGKLESGSEKVRLMV